MVTVPLPHLAGLAAAVRVDLDDRVPTMGVFASGRLVANPAFTARLSGDDLVFVLAHELLATLLVLRISKTSSSADFSRAPGMSRPPAGIAMTPSACRSMSLMM